MKTKKLAILTCCVLLLVGVVGGTLAWLTAQTPEVKNTFTVGNINIDLYEHQNEGDTAEIKAKTYKMVPGDTLFKDPTVKVVAGSEECYLFVEVIKENRFDEFMEYEIIDGADGWAPLTGVEDVYWKLVDADTAAAGITYGVLVDDEVTVKDTVTKDNMDEVGNNLPTMTFKAYAVQKAHVADAAAAWKILFPTED